MERDGIAFGTETKLEVEVVKLGPSGCPIDSVYISAILISGGFTSTAMLDVLAFSNTSIGQPLGPSLTTSTSNFFW